MTENQFNFKTYGILSNPKDSFVQNDVTEMTQIVPNHGF